MALVLPILLILVFGITEFGRAWMTVNILQTAAREGARLAVVTSLTPTGKAAVVARSTAVCDAAAIHGVTVNCSDVDALTLGVTVTVSTDFHVVTGRVLDTFQGTIPLSAQTTMRSEGGG